MPSSIILPLWSLFDSKDNKTLQPKPRRACFMHLRAECVYIFKKETRRKCVSCFECTASAAPAPASAPQELTHKGCGDASMRKRSAQATSLNHSKRESGNQNKGKLSSPWGICRGWRCCWKCLLWKKNPKSRYSPKNVHHPSRWPHNPRDEWAFVRPWDPSAYGRTQGW